VTEKAKAKTPKRPGSMDLLGRTGAGKAPQIERMPHPSLRVMLPMRDGVALDTYVWLPKQTAHAPAILLRTPYREDVLGWKRMGHLRFVEAGYALIFQMIRGQGLSEGTFSFNAPHEKSDAYDTIEWIAGQPWSDGNVGMDGGSYGGMTGLAAAAARAPHLKCVFCSVPTTDFFRDVPYFGGGFCRMHTINWTNLIQIESLAELTGGFVGVMPILSQPDWLDRSLSRPAIDAADGVLRGDKLAHYRDALSHPTYDAWWRERTLQGQDYAAMDLPLLLVSGVFDLSTGTMTVWEGLTEHAPERSDRQLLIGPWDHGQVSTGADESYGPFELGEAALGDPNDIRQAFFDRHLKGVGAGPDIGGKAKIYITGRNIYRSFDAYPPREVSDRSLFLASGGGANTRRGDGRLVEAEAQGPPDAMSADPNLPFVGAMTSALDLKLDLREHALNADTLVYATAPLAAALTILGEPRLVLHVKTDTPDADIGAYLAELRPDGAVVQLSSLLLRLRYRQGFDREAPMKPGEAAQVEIKLTFMAHEFAKGIRIALLLRGDMFPLVDPNPNTGEPIAAATSTRIARIEILHDSAHPSRLLLPVLEG
jgi:putative CocE/NonD family hydrolase